jgi:hypothetical protein
VLTIVSNMSRLEQVQVSAILCLENIPSSRHFHSGMIYYNRDSGVVCGGFERPYADWRIVGYRISCYSSRTRTEAPDVPYRPCVDLPSVE